MPLPGAPDIVAGILNVGGELVTIVDFSRRVGLPFAAIDPSQQLLMVDMADFVVGFIVDKVHGVTSRQLEETITVPERLGGADFVEAVVTLKDGLSIIVDPEKFLFDNERVQLSVALKKARHET
jgi:purine-binding chemotaxis protein CheW